jgi:hypothetical protein
MLLFSQSCIKFHLKINSAHAFVTILELNFLLSPNVMYTYIHTYIHTNTCISTYVVRIYTYKRTIKLIEGVKMKMAVFWDVAPCSLVDNDRRFRGAYCQYHHLDDRMMKAVSSS